MTNLSDKAELNWSPIARFATSLERDDTPYKTLLSLPAFIVWLMARFCVHMLLETYDHLINRVIGIIFTLWFAASTVALISISATGWAGFFAVIAKIFWITSTICGVADALTERQEDRLEHLEWDRRFPNGWNIDAARAWEAELETQRRHS